MGFVSDIEKYMVSADVMLSKAGPGAIAEAAACALPMLLYDFLPGQEEANIAFVRDHCMGGYEVSPELVAERLVHSQKSVFSAII